MIAVRGESKAVPNPLTATEHRIGAAYNALPSPCWGDEKKVAAWLSREVPHDAD